MSEQRYKVLEHIDAGGMAEVFKANSSSVKGFDKLVAIKRILPSLTKNERFVRMFLDEAKVSLFLNHTNVVQVFDLVYAENTYLIIMEYVNGVNLKRLIEDLPNIPVQCVAYIAIEMSKGLAHAHNKCDRNGNSLGIVHRDVSPANIMVSVEGEVKVTDFGLAKARDQVEKTDPGVVKGKFGYLSPEAAYGKPVDARTDIFAVGILLWEMLTGERLFLGDTDLDTLKQVRKNRVKPASTIRPEVPSSLDAIIRRALATDPEHRYQRIEDMIGDLTKFMFSYGKPVSSLDIAALVNQLKSKSRPVVRTTEDRVLEQELQEAVNKFVSLEKILSESEDLDRYMAEVYGSMESNEPSKSGASGEVNFEDPNLWADLGLDEAELGLQVGERTRMEFGSWHQRPISKMNPTETARLKRQKRLENQSGEVENLHDTAENEPPAVADSESDNVSPVTASEPPSTEKTPPPATTTSAEKVDSDEYDSSHSLLHAPTLKKMREEARSQRLEQVKEREDSKGRTIMIVIVIALIVAILVILAYLTLSGS